MRKKLLITLLCGLMVFSVTGCGKDEKDKVIFKVENSDELSDTSFGINNLIKVGDGLYYDKTTLIVYFWNGWFAVTKHNVSSYDTSPTPYYAPNGLPYRYDPKTNTFMEIKTGGKK